MNEATYYGQIVVRRRGEGIVRNKNLHGTIKTDLPLGNGKAKAGNIRGFKHWLGDNEGGISVESTVTVQVTCGQSEKAIIKAAKRCGEIAKKIADDGIHEMDGYVRDFMEGGK